MTSHVIVVNGVFKSAGGIPLTWLPLGPDHAIERVRFEVQFSEALPKKMVEQLGLRHDARAVETRFGSRQEQQVAKFLVGPNGPTIAPGGGGNEVSWLSTRVQGVGNAAVEALTLQNSLLSYESSDYRGWSKAFSRFKNVCGEILSEAGNLVNAASATLEYSDRFVFQGDVTQARPDGLLRAHILALLPEIALSGQELWHVHRGWFEKLGEDKCLVNQNFDAQLGTADFKKEARSIQIFSKCEVRKENGGFDMTDLIPKFDSLHERSLELFASSITDGLTDKIGLKKGDPK